MGGESGKLTVHPFIVFPGPFWGSEELNKSYRYHRAKHKGEKRQKAFSPLRILIGCIFYDLYKYLFHHKLIVEAGSAQGGLKPHLRLEADVNYLQS